MSLDLNHLVLIIRQIWTTGHKTSRAGIFVTKDKHEEITGDIAVGELYTNHWPVYSYNQINTWESFQ